MALKADLRLKVSGLGTSNVTETVVYILFFFTLSEPMITVRSNGVIWLSGMLTCHLYQAEGPLLVLSVLQVNPQDESEIGPGLSRMVITSRFGVCSTFSHKSAEAYSRQLEYCRRVSQKVVAFSGA